VNAKDLRGIIHPTNIMLLLGTPDTLTGTLLLEITETIDHLDQFLLLVAIETILLQ
jgi:hypothetical protein